MGTKKIVFVGLVFILVIGAGFYFLPSHDKSPGVAENKSENVQNADDLQAQRASYGISENVFSKLPSPPSDFNRMVSMYTGGPFTDESFFSEKYFLQPEFYPSFIPNGLHYWTDPAATHWGAYGYGSFPVQKNEKIPKGGSIRAVFFLHSGYGVRSYQGFDLKIRPDQRGAEKYFSAKIIEPQFLLGPNFPRFSADWARKIEIEITCAPDTPAGFYSFSVENANPPEEKITQWTAIARSFGSGYFNAGFVSTQNPLYRIVVQAK